MINLNYSEEYNKVNAKISELYDEIEVLRNKKRELQCDAIDLKGKFLAIKDSVYDDEPSTYAYCYDSFYTTDDNGEKAWCLNCVSFSGCISDYMDMCYMKYDQLEQIYISNSDLTPVEEDIKRFEIITKDEYINKFTELIDKVKKEQLSINFDSLIN